MRKREVGSGGRVTRGVGSQALKVAQPWRASQLFLISTLWLACPRQLRGAECNVMARN